MSGLSSEDRMWLERKFEAVHSEIKQEGSKVHKLDLRTAALEGAAVHSCEAAIKKHAKDSLVHNPYKAGVFWGAVLGGVEVVKKLLWHG